MSDLSAPPRLYRIDVVDHVGRAYRTVFDHVRSVFEIALLPYLIVLSVKLVSLLFTHHGGTVGRIAAALIHAVSLLLFGAVFVVRWHRLVLLGETVGGRLLPPGWREFVIAGIKVGVAVIAGWVLLVGIALLPPGAITVPATAAGGVALTLSVLRVTLIFPAAAIGQPVTLRTAWDWVTGNFWRLFGAAFACYFPFVVLQMLISGLASAFPSLTWVVFEALRLAVSFASAAVVAALLSHLYRDLAAEAT